MSKFCTNSGSVMEDNAVFCTNCGAQEAPVFQGAPVGEAYAAPVENVVNDNKKKMITLIAAGAALVVAIVLLIVSFSGGYKDSVKNLEAVMNGKANKIESLAPKAYWDYLEDEEDVDLKDLKEDFEDNYEDLKDELEDKYGKNAKIKMKVTDHKKLKSKKLSAIAESIEETYDIDENKVKAAYELEVEMTVKGKEDEDNEEMELVAVKISGKWYPVMVIEYGDEISVAFMISMFSMLEMVM